MKIFTLSNKFQKIISAIFWVLVWQAVYLIVNKEILVVSPFDVLKNIVVMCGTSEFWITAFFSILRTFIGFLGAVILGCVLAVFTNTFKLAYNLFYPLLSAVKATPVVSFIIITLVWFNSGFVPVFMAFLMVIPIVYTNMNKGISETDKRLLEMAKIYKFSTLKKVLYIYFPSVRAYFVSACVTGFGLAWKAAVAAEVICVPKYSVGEKLYTSKIYLETLDLFSWTAVLIILSIVFEKILIFVFNKSSDIFSKKRVSKFKPTVKRLKNSVEAVRLENISKSYGKNKVLKNVNIVIPNSKIICLYGASGCGKTTMANIAAGLLRAEGNVTPKGISVSYIFQEDRLLPWFTALENVMLVSDRAEYYLKAVGLWDFKDYLPESLSGGMCRRVNIARALSFDYDLLIMDEPFKGLNSELKMSIIGLIRKELSFRSGLLITHDIREAVMFADEIIKINPKDNSFDERIVLEVPFENRTAKYINEMSEKI